MSQPFLYQEIDRIYAKTIGTGARSLCVTSSRPGEGTTSVVYALAQRASAVNLKVLIVDLNLHNPFVSNAVEPTPDEHQLTIQMPSLVPPPDWDTAIGHQATMLPVKQGAQIGVIPKPSTDNAVVKFREHTRIQQMLQYWQQDYDCVIFDTSPLCLVNQKNIPPQHVASCCDQTLVVVKSGKTLSHQLKEAISILNTVPVNFAGTVINDYENPTLGAELVRQCSKLQQRLPRLSNALINKIRRSRFLFADF